MWFVNKINDFLGISPVFALVDIHPIGWHTLLTIDGFAALTAPVFPAILVMEAAFLCIRYRRDPKKVFRAYKVPMFTWWFHAITRALVSLTLASSLYFAISSHAPFHVPLTWYGFAYSFVAWSLGHYVWHWMAHRMRIFWCLHAPHHAPTHMNCSVLFTGQFFQLLHADVIRLGVCALLGVPFPLLFLVGVVDGFWGSVIHISEEVLPNGRLGFLNRIMLTPSHHRVHHASNDIYIDKNYCNTLNIWDKIFGTLQDELPDEKPVYGLSREINTDSLVDMYLGETILLLEDLRKARSFKEQILYLVMPPSWKPTVKT